MEQYFLQLRCLFICWIILFPHQPKSPISGSQTLYKRKIACLGVGQKKCIATLLHIQSIIFPNTLKVTVMNLEYTGSATN